MAAGDLLRFDERRRLLDEVLSGWGGPGAPVARDAGLIASSIRAAPRSAWSAALSRRDLRALLNRIVRNAEGRLVYRARAASRPTYVTGLFMSSWRTEREPSSDLLFDDRIILLNPVPYASYVHRKGAHRRDTVVKLYIRPLVDQARAEVLQDVESQMRRIADLAMGMVAG